jgi:transcriptional regulator NrdR family protein
MKCTTCGHEGTAVLETRKLSEGQVTRRRHGCGHCGATFNTYEVDDRIWKSVKRLVINESRVAGITRRQRLFHRNEQILELLKRGEKHSVVASQFGLSDNMISTIARKAGVPSYARQRGIKVEKAMPKARYVR